MSSERNLEVVSCDASIMKNVWEIRVRDYDQKLQVEEDRVKKSALPSINQDWAGRLAARIGGYKRVEARRERKLPEPQVDNSNVWKSKQPLPPPSLPRGAGLGPHSRPTAQSRGFSTPTTSNNHKKVQDKSVNKLQLLMLIPQTQPSAMVWGKSWKYNKCLPLQEEGATTWGKCWMFATQQPFSEPGMPWLNGPNMMDPHNLYLWGKPGYRMMESQDLDLILPTEPWQMSWQRSDKNNQDTRSGNGEDIPKFFTLLVETQHHNEALCSSEWCDSWTSTKPSNQQDPFTGPTNGLKNESIANKQDMDKEMSSKWEECWRLVNHHGCSKSKLPQRQKSHSPEWANSWRAAMMVSNNHKKVDSSQRQDNSHTCNDHYQRLYFHDMMPVSREERHRDLYWQLCNEFEALSEWSKSWQIPKNNSKPCEEIEKVLKASPPRMENAAVPQMKEKNSQVQYSTSEKADPRYEQLKHDIIYRPVREFTQSKLFLLRHLERVLPSEWRECWKIIKHRMRLERRRMRPNPLQPFRDTERERNTMSNASEWKNSWKYTCTPMQQDPDLWQQGWSTTAPIRVDRAWDQNHFAPVELPKNGPTGERSWEESWRFSRRQHRSAPVQNTQGRSGVPSLHSDNSRAQRRHNRPTSDWQPAWMVSETQFHHDNPSLTQWREAWKWSIYHTQHWIEQMPVENWLDESMEIRPLKEKVPLQRAEAKMSRSFDNQMFRERYPEKEWSPSWKAGSLLSHQSSQHGSSRNTGTSASPTGQQQHASTGECGSQWGKSFRLANPMPRLEQPWVESYPNLCHYSVMWSKEKKIQNNINFRNNLPTFKLWEKSHRFLQGASAQMKNKSGSKAPTDPRVIVTKGINTRKHLYSNIEKDKQVDKKFLGCHLLGKTQPRPKKGSAEKIKLEDNKGDFEEWGESWRFLVRPESLKKQTAFKSLSGWDESWKFLIPPFQTLNGPKPKTR